MPLSHSTLLPLIKLQQKVVSGILSRLAFLKTGFTLIFFRVLQKKSIIMLLIVGILNNFTTKETHDSIEQQPEFPLKAHTVQ